MSKEEIVHLRLLKSGVIQPFDSAKEAFHFLFGIQSQSQQSAEINLFNRVANLSKTQLQKQYDTNEVIKIWAQRMTVHMFLKEDWKLVQQVFASRNNYVHRGWADKKDVYDRIIDDMHSFSGQKKFTKKEIIEVIDKHASHVESEYRDYSIIVQSTLEGIIFGVPATPHTKHFLHRDVCIGDYDSWKETQHKAIEELLRRYFHGYGPASLRDFCHWSGLSQKEVKPFFDNISDEFVVIASDMGDLYLHKDDEDINKISQASKGVRLLGKFDPLFLSFYNKSWIVSKTEEKLIWRPAAIVEAVVLIDEKFAGTWRYEINKDVMSFNISLIKKIDADAKKMIKEEAKKISEFMGKRLDKINYI